MRTGVRGVLLAVVGTVVACNSSTETSDLSMPGGSDLAVSADGAGDDGAAGDLAGQTSGDLAGAPDLAKPTCIPAGPAMVSPQTRPRMTLPLAASNGTATMVLWSVFPGSTFQKAVWAELQNGAVVASGDLPFGNDTGQARLFVFQSAFYAFHAGDKKLYAFDGAKWSAVLSSVDFVVAGGSQILGLSGRPSSFAAATAVFWDGAKATAPQQISANSFVGAASDGANGFGVVTLNKTTLGFLTFSGTAWSTESTVGTATIPFGATLNSVSLAHAGSLWCFDYAFFANGWTTWVGAGSTWTSAAASNANESVGAVLANNGTFAVSVSGGKVMVYQNGAWTATQLASTGAIDSTVLQPFGNGYVYLYTSLTTSSLKSAFFDGTQWGAATDVLPSPTGYISNLAPAVSGSTIALGIGLDQVVIYEGGKWGTAFKLTTSTPANVGWAIATFQGGDVVAVYPDPGVMSSRTRTGTTWGAALALPASASSGPVLNAALGRARNGHALAVWSQWDAGVIAAYGSEYDGCAWGAPVLLTGLYAGTSMAVAANASTFLITAYSGVQTQLARWTGSGITTPMTFGNGNARVASDGATFVAAWSDAGGNLVATTSSDGQTWPAAQQVEAGPGWMISELAGGPAGVVEISSVSGGAANAHARIWRAGTWSAATTLTVAAGYICKASIGNTSALVLCSGTSTADASLFDAGAWSDVPLSATIYAQPALYALGTDGVDYRADYGQFMPYSAVLHAGAWSTPAQAQSINAYTMTGLVGKSGAWALAAEDAAGDFFVTRATGSAAYTTAATTTLSTVQGPLVATGLGSRWPGEADVFWVGNTAAWKDVQVLYVDLGL